MGQHTRNSEYDQEILQSQTAENPWHREEEPHNNHETNLANFGTYCIDNPARIHKV